MSGLSPPDENLPSDTPSGPPKVSFKKRSARPKQAIRASFKDDSDSDDSGDDVKVVKPTLSAAERHRRRLGQSDAQRSSRGSPAQTPSGNTSDYLNELKASTSVRSAPEPEVQKSAGLDLEAEFIPLDPDAPVDDELRDEEVPNTLDIDEGAGYEDDELPIGDRMTRLRLEQKRRDMQQAINEFSDESQSSDDDWEQSRLSNARQAAPDILARKREHALDDYAEIPPVPLPDEALAAAYKNLDRLKGSRLEIQDAVGRLENERDLVESRMAEVQAAINRVSEDFERLSAHMATRQSAI